MTIDRTSKAYFFGRFTGKVIIFVVGLFLGRKYFQKPMKKSFPEKDEDND